MLYRLREESSNREHYKIELHANGKFHIYNRVADPNKSLFPFPDHCGLSMEGDQAVMCHLVCDETVEVKVSHECIVAYGLPDFFCEL